jgi:hypothetical protein
VVVLMVDAVAGAHGRCPCCPEAVTNNGSIDVEIVAASAMHEWSGAVVDPPALPTRARSLERLR